jgi:hypothetical protein
VSRAVSKTAHDVSRITKFEMIWTKTEDFGRNWPFNFRFVSRGNLRGIPKD